MYAFIRSVALRPVGTGVQFSHMEIFAHDGKNFSHKFCATVSEDFPWYPIPRHELIHEDFGDTFSVVSS
jgi:hypothetical protein